MGVFYTDDMKLRAILDGDFAVAKPEVKTFDPIFGPTPFKPSQTGVIIAMFEKQTCARCHKSSFSYTGIFRAMVEEKATRYLAIEPGTAQPESKEISCATIPACFECL